MEKVEHNDSTARSLCGSRTAFQMGCALPRATPYVYEVCVLAWHHRVRKVSIGEKIGVRGTKKLVICVVCSRSVLLVVRFAAERLRARPIGRVSLVPIPAGLLWDPKQESYHWTKQPIGDVMLCSVVEHGVP